MDKTQAEEYVRCRKDPIYFIKKYGKIRHPTKGLLSFDLWDFQEDALESFLDKSYNIILKARQLGLSTLCAAYGAWMANFFKNKEIYILATKRDTATNLVDKVRVFLDGVPKWLRSEVTIDNRQSIELANGSKIKAGATGSNARDAARSEALSLLIIDEAAFIKSMDNIWTAAQPTLATGGDCIVISSPNGIGNWFHKSYIEAEAGVSERVGTKNISFNPIALPWNLHPERDEEWGRDEKKKIGEQAFAQEHDCDFLQSGNNVVSLKALSWYEEHPNEEEESDGGFRPFMRDPEEKTWMDKNLWIWKYPDYTKKYILSADVARGDGDDFSAFHIIDIESYEQVAEYKGKVNTDVYAHLVHNTAIQYNNAYVIVENASMGHHVVMKLIEMEYKNMYWTIKDLTRIHESNSNQLHYDPYNVPPNAVPGFTMSMKSRPVCVARLEEDLRTHDFILHSKRTQNELETFVFHNGKPEAMSSYNDDLVMSLAIGMYVRATTLKFNSHNDEMTKQLLSGMTFSSTPYEFGIYKTDEQKKEEQFTFDTGNGQREDLRWMMS